MTNQNNEAPETHVLQWQHFARQSVEYLVYLDGFKNRFAFALQFSYLEMCQPNDITAQIDWAKQIVKTDWIKAGKPEANND